MLGVQVSMYTGVGSNLFPGFDNFMFTRNWLGRCLIRCRTPFGRERRHSFQWRRHVFNRSSSEYFLNRAGYTLGWQRTAASLPAPMPVEFEPKENWNDTCRNFP